MISVEIFSGCGGLAKGLEKSGFKHKKFVEFNSDACNTLRTNFGSSKVFEGDVRDFDFKSLEEIDVVAGGPPCQPFSLGGKHKSFDDHRDMFPHAIKAIECLSPKAFIFENVKGLLRESFSDYFLYILLRLTFPKEVIGENEDWKTHLIRLKKIDFSKYKNTSYRVKFELLNAADYGVPQKRERVVIVGIRSDLNKIWNFPNATHNEDRLLWDKFVSFEYWKRHDFTHQPSLKEVELANRLIAKFGIFEPVGEPWQTMRDAMFDVPHPSSNHGISDHIFRDGARTYAGHTGSDFDSPSKTIKAGGHGVPGGENMIRFDDGCVRYLTTYEAKLIQTFPRDFVITGAWGESMRQIGNAVPVRLAEILGKHLRALLRS